MSLNSIEPGDDKVSAIRNFPAPRNAQEVRRSLGLTGFFRKFVRDYARIAHPLNEKLKTVNNPQFVWGPEQTTAFEDLGARDRVESLKLQEFDFTLEHRPGTQLAYVDALSCAPVEPAGEATPVAECLMRVDVSQTDWLITMQRQDAALLQIMKTLRGTETSEKIAQLRIEYELKDH